MNTLPRVAALMLACTLPGAALACPDVSQSGYGLSYTSDEAYSPRAHGVVAGGGSDLQSCGGGLFGHVAVAPDFELTFTANGAGRALEFRVEGECDTILLVNDATGQWHYNDDDADLNPRIRIAAASEGLYDIWVGTFGPDLCQAQLIVETF
jgi:hypothetical protein